MASTSLKRALLGLFGAFLTGAGAVLVVVSLGPLSNLFAEYQDSAASTYLVAGLPFLILGLAGIIGGIVALARSAGRDQAGGGEDEDAASE